MQIPARQILQLTTANLKARYRNTWSGFLWVVMNPVLMFGAQSYAFKFIMNIQVENYLLFLLSGLIPWIFISQNLEMGTPIFVNSGRLLKSFPLNPLTLILAQILDNLINTTVAFFVILVPVFVLHPFPLENLLYLPIPVVFLTLTTFFLAWFLSTLNVFFRDIKFIVTFLLQVSFYMTPIFYPIAFIDEQYRWLLTFNPFYLMITPFRALLEVPVFSDYLWQLGLAGLIMIISGLMAFIFWKVKRNVVYFYL